MPHALFPTPSPTVAYYQRENHLYKRGNCCGVRDTLLLNGKLVFIRSKKNWKSLNRSLMLFHPQQNYDWMLMGDLAMKKLIYGCGLVTMSIRNCPWKLSLLNSHCP